MKYEIILVPIILSAVGAVSSQFLDETEACFVQYLKVKGKVDSSFQSIIEPTENCVDKLSSMLQSLRAFIDNEIRKEMPDELECLLGAMENQECVDHFIMIYVLRLNMFLSEDEIKMLLATSRAQLKLDLETIAFQCKVDDKNFVQIFNKNLGIKNETLDALQYEYCIAKYCVDNKFLELNYEINPNNIATDDVNCTSIIAIDRYNAEKEFADEYITTPEAIEAKACIMQKYRNAQRYEFFAAIKVLGNELNARRTKEADVIKITEKLTGPSFTQSMRDCMSNSNDE